LAENSGTNADLLKNLEAVKSQWTEAGEDTTDIDEWIAAVKAEGADAANDGAMATAGTFAAAIFATTLALF